MSEWKKVKIGDICKIVKGTTGIASAEPGQYPLVVTAEERKTCSTYQFDCEAVCIPLVSSSGHGKKSLKNVHYQSGKFALGTILCAVIPNNPQELDARYLHQYLQFYKDIILVPLMKGAANVSLSMKDIATVEFPLPPIERQRELSNLFVSLQEKQKELSSEYEKQTEYAKLLRQNILQQAIEGKLTADWRKQNPVQKGNPDYDAEALFEQIQLAKRELIDKRLILKKTQTKPFYTDSDYPFDIPKEWKLVQLADISIIQEGAGIRKYQYAKEGIQLLCVTNILNGKVDLNLKKLFITNEEYKLKYKHLVLNKGDIVSSCSGGSWGKVAFYNLNDTVVMNTSTIRLRTFKDIALNQYLYNICTSSFFKNQLKAQLVGMQPNFGYAHYSRIMIPLPPLKEQEEIVNKVERLLAKVTTLENQIQDRKSLSDKLVFGIIKENLEGK